MLQKSVLLFLGGLFVLGCKNPKEAPTSEPSLKEKIGQMVMVGFRGTLVQEGDPIYRMIDDHYLGGVVLYSRDLPSKETVKRNVSSPQQLKALTRQLQSINNTQLWIAIDEEGGFVTRLSAQNGFEQHLSHQTIGRLNNTDSTQVWAAGMAKELSDLGINMNFGPVLDLNVNPHNPIIGKRERSFSADVHEVMTHGRIFMEEHRKKGILCVPKHFPGHGSSDSDTHKGLANVTHTWSKEELEPFKTVVEEGYANVVMTSHVYNANLDTLPATLSPKIINGVLRHDFGFEEVIISDDMQMRAISNFYDFEMAIERALKAGVDVLLFSNNAAPCAETDPDCLEIPFNPEIAKQCVEHVLKLVEAGRITENRIDQSYRRIRALKTKA